MCLTMAMLVTGCSNKSTKDDAEDSLHKQDQQEDVQDEKGDLEENDNIDEKEGEYMAERLNRSEEHTSEHQPHSEISYAVFCLKKNSL